MRKILTPAALCILFSILIAACSGKTKDKSTAQDKAGLYLVTIDSLEKAMKNSRETDINYNTAMFAIKIYDEFATYNPTHPRAAECVFKAGELSSGLKLPDAAINYFTRYIDSYPNNEHAPHCFFLKAFVYEDQLHDTANARKFYNLLIEKYPDHKLVKDAAASVKNLGKTPEQLIREFENMNKQEALP